MPSRNSLKDYASEQYYHVYNRGANKLEIFHDDKDYIYFLYLLKRHLSPETIADKFGREYKNLSQNVKLVAYCLMPNHFHLLLFNVEKDGMELLMRSVVTAYSMYYNKKYRHSGRLFQGVYKASTISTEPYVQHISRYIHRNPKDYKTYPYSSYQPLVSRHETPWLSDVLFSDVFEGSIEDYKKFVADYKDYKETIDDISFELADD